MKKIVSFFLAALMIFSSLSIVSFALDETKLNKQNYLLQKVVTDGNENREYKNYTYDSKGRITKSVASYGNSNYSYDITMTYTYDSKGNISKSTKHYKDDEGEYVKNTITYRYDSKNYLTSTTETGSTEYGSYISNVAYTYDNAKKLIKTVERLIDEDGIRTSTVDYKYNAAGQVVEKEESYYNSSYTYVYKYTYNSKSLLTKVVRYSTYDDGDVSESDVVTYKYDSNNNLTSIVENNDYPMSYKYTYDSNGHVTKEVFAYDDEVRTTTNTYDAKGNRTASNVSKKENNKTIETITKKYTYDANNNIAKESYAGKNDWLTEKRTTAYNYVAAKMNTVENGEVICMFDNSINETGKAITPDVYVITKNIDSPNNPNTWDYYCPLIKGIDYKLSYKNNVKAGKASIALEFIGDYSYLKPVTLDFTIVATISKVSNIKVSKVNATSLTLTWDKLSGAKKYKVEKSLDGKTFETVKTVDTNSLSVTSLKANANHYFRVTALNSSNKVVGKASDILKVKTLVTAPKKAKVTATTMTLTLAKISGAKTYKVEYSTDGKTWKSAGSFTSNEVKVTGLSAGTKYQFRARAYNSNGAAIGNVSASLKTETLCSAPTIKLTSTSSKTATVEITKVKGATKYVVATSTDNSTWKKLSPTTSTKYTIKNLAAGKKIYVKVQVLNSENLASGYSKVASVTVKK